MPLRFSESANHRKRQLRVGFGDHRKARVTKHQSTNQTRAISRYSWNCRIWKKLFDFSHARRNGEIERQSEHKGTESKILCFLL